MATSDDSGTYIGDWDNTIPADSALKSKGAAEIRKVKGNIDATFPNFTGAAVTATEAELNILDGVTSTAAELNILDGVTSTAAELNILDGVTATTAELNILDGVTATAAEINYLDLTTGAGTAEASKALVLDSNGYMNVLNATGNIGAGTASANAAYCTIGYGRTGDNTSAYLMYSDSAAPTTASANLSRGSGANGSLTLNNTGTGAVIVSSAGTEALRVDSSQRVLIGTTSGAPSFNLKVDGNAILDTSGNADTVLRLDSTAGYDAEIQFYEGNNSEAYLTWNAPTNGLLLACSGGAQHGLYENGTHTFVSNGVEFGRFDTSGYLLVGYTSSNGAYKLQVNSQIFATSATIATSDARYKENVSTIDNGLELVNRLNPVSFTWKEHPVHEFDLATTNTGFLAQEVQEAWADQPFINSLVKGNECELPDGTKEEFLGLADSGMISVLVSAVKELSSQVDSLKAEVAALKAG